MEGRSLCRHLSSHIFPIWCRKIVKPVYNFLSFFSLMRSCNLLWYVCSRGPLRPIFLTALLSLISLLQRTSTPSAALLLTPPRRGLPAWPALKGDPHRACVFVVKDAMGVRFVFAVIEPAICGHVSLIRHTRRPPPLTHRPCLDVSQDPACGCCWGRMGWVVLLIDNKRRGFPPCLIFPLFMLGLDREEEDQCSLNLS